MKKSFSFTLPLEREECFDFLLQCGRRITTWSSTHKDDDKNYLEWKQNIWSLTGSAVILAHLKARPKNQTTITVEVIKPFQLIDPFKILDRIFVKFERTCLEYLPKTQE